jgi:hypothetical protein
MPTDAPTPASTPDTATITPDTDPRVHLVDPAEIDADALPRDRTTLDETALVELETSILLTGLRQPIEVWEFRTPRPDAAGGHRYGLISGMRRLSAFKRIHAGNPDARIPAFLRHPADIPDAMAKLDFVRFLSGPSPEDALVCYELEGVAEGHDDAAHIVDILPFAPV